ASLVLFLNGTATTETYTLSLHDALPILPAEHRAEFDDLLDEARAGYALHDEDVGTCYTWPLGLIRRALLVAGERLSSRGALDRRSEEHTSELQSLAYLVCRLLLEKKKK